MKKISKIFGIAVTIALLASMIVATVPASALTLRWFPESDVPKTDDYKLGTAGIDIVDLAANGDVIYAATANLTGGLYKSTDGGDSWSSLASTTFYQLYSSGSDVEQVAVAPDDPDVVAISCANNRVLYSENGGASWSGLSVPGTNFDIDDLDVSTGPLRYVAAVGDNGTVPQMYKMYMAMAQSWTEEYQDALNEGEDTTQTGILAVKFSPNYQTDKLITIVSTNSTGACFQVFWDESDDWNAEVTGFDANYPVPVGSVGNIAAASIAFPDTYLGTSETDRIAFVSVATASSGGVYRLSDYSIGAAGSFTTWSSGSTGPIGSVAYNEAGKLIAGVYNDNKVYSCTSPMAAFPKFQREKALKQPGGTTKTVVAWSGDTAVAATSGDESALAISTDDGLTFNDYALIDTTLTALTDVAVTADGGKLYMASTNASTDGASLWLKASAWKRVLSTGITAGNSLIVRVAPDDSDAVYLAEKDTTNVWVSKDGGVEDWKAVPCYKADTTGVVDMAIYDADTVYVLDSDGVSVTTNGGASWGTKKSLDGLSGAYDIALASNGDVLVGGNAGVAFSTDAGASFTKITFPFGEGTEGVTVIADPDYANNNYFYAGGVSSTTTGAVSIWRCTASKSAIPSGSNAPDLVLDTTSGMTNNRVKGMATDGDVLWVLACNGSESQLYRALNYRTAATETLALWSYTESSAELQVGAPNALKMSDGPKFWAVSGASLYSINDPIAQVGPTLNTPTDGTSVGVNPETGKAYNVTFSLDRYSSTYIDQVTIQIANDSAFQGVIYEQAFDISAISGDTVSKIIGPTGVSAASPSAVNPNCNVDFNPGETYYWRARSNNTLYGPLISAWSAGNSFSIAQVDTFQLSGPTVGAADVSLTPTFTWAEYKGAIGYEIVLSEDPSFAIIEWSRNVDQNFYKVDAEEALKYSTTYYWRVRGVTGESVLQGQTWVTPAGPWITGVFTTMAEPVEEEAPEPVVITEPGKTEVKVVEVPVTQAPVIPTYLLWVIVAVGAILIIALIVLIVRTRRVA